MTLPSRLCKETFLSLLECIISTILCTQQFQDLRNLWWVYVYIEWRECATSLMCVAFCRVSMWLCDALIYEVIWCNNTFQYWKQSALATNTFWITRIANSWRKTELILWLMSLFLYLFPGFTRPKNVHGVPREKHFCPGLFSLYKMGWNVDYLANLEGGECILP